MPAPHRFAIGIYLAALALRLIPVFLTRGLGIGLDDMFQYDMLARSLAAGEGFRWYARDDVRMLEPYVDFDLSGEDYDPERGVLSSFRAPLYPAFLAAVYSISGTGFGRFFAARLAQAVLLAAPLAPLTYLTARALLRPSGLPETERTARLAAWAVTLYPMLVIFPLGLGTENLFFLLVLAAFFALLKSAEQPSAVRFVVNGLLLGLAALTRSVILPFAGLAILWLWLTATPTADPRLLASRRLRGPMLTILALALTVLPWVVRNSLLHGRLTGIETSLGYNLYVGYHPQSNGSFTFGPSLDLVPILDDKLRDELGTEKALEFIRADPARFVPLAVSRLGHFFRLELRVLTYFYSSNFFGPLPAALLLAIAALVGLPFALLGLSAAGGAVLLPHDRGALLVGLLFLGYITPHIFILSEERFHLTLIPFLAMLAALLWSRGTPALAERFSRSATSRAAVISAGAAACLLLLNWGFQFWSEAERFARLLGPDGNRTFFPY